MTSRYHSPSATERPVEAEVEDDRAVAGREAAAAAGDLGEEGGDVERDQDEGRRGAGEQAAASPTPLTTGCAGWRTPGSACRPGSASCSRGRSAARRRSRRRRSRGSGGGNKSAPSGREPTIAADGGDRGASPAALRDAGRRRARRRRHRRLLLQLLVRLARATSTTSSGSSPSTAGTTSSTSSPGRSACWSPATRPPVRALARLRLHRDRDLGVHHRQRRVDPRLHPGQHRGQLPRT